VSPAHTLHIVSGKGGTGKTTIAGALACALATKGRRVLVCEVEGRHGLSELFGTPQFVGAEERRVARTPAGGQVFGLSVDAEDALLEYLDTWGSPARRWTGSGPSTSPPPSPPDYGTCC
jgi:anion-transporting  ArsA/GET3 family ATPase